ncbi:hypothetical protein H8356DRAFT_955996 [Neocallimastix lanati (nom. inval.)]|nr:hypothetical protein H8356DRAFT_955996 [Neocallimastix sp. JGI-2020a]
MFLYKHNLLDIFPLFVCTYNDNETIIHCDDTYVPGFLFIKESTYMHCGKEWDYNCENNDECSSKMCKDGCTQQSKRHEENGGRVDFGLVYAIFFWVYTNICICHGINNLLLSFLHKGKKKKINIKYCIAKLSYYCNNNVINKQHICYLNALCYIIFEIALLIIIRYKI